MEKKKALIIGINEYEDSSFERLKYAESDAKAIYDILINPDAGDFKKEDVILLAGKSKSEAEENLEAILSEAKRDDLVFIYFAGHGKLDRSGKLCLASRNTKTDKLLSTSVHLEDIRRMIDNSDCKRVVFIIDSCFSGAVGQSFRSADVPAESLEQISGHGKVIISASQAFERARERDDIGHGIFTYNLVKGLEGEADHDGDGYISVDELYRYVCDKVKSETKNQQVPMKWGMDEKGEIIVAKSTKNLEKKREEIERLSESARVLQNQGRLDEAQDAWGKVLQLDSKNTDAPQAIKQIAEEEKKRTELEARIDKLFEYYQKRMIPPPIYNRAVGIIKNPQFALGDKEDIFARLIEDLLSDNLTVENFVLSWSRIEKPEGQDGQLKQEEDKVQAERAKREEERRKQEQVSKLYEGARDMAHAGQWEEALKRMGEIQTLDSQFADPEGLSTKAREQLEKAERLNREKKEVSPRRGAPVIDQIRKQTKILVGAGVIALIIIAVIVHSMGTAPTPKIDDFKATPETIEKGKSSVLSWKTSNAKEAEISGIGKVELAGSATVNPAETATYTLTARNGERKTVDERITINVTIPTSKDVPKAAEVVRGWLGVKVQQITNEIAQSMNLKEPKGALVLDVSPGSPAEKAGIRKQDIITEFNGQEIKNVQDLPKLVAAIPPGAETKLKLMRDGKQETIELRLGENQVLYEDNFTTLDPAWEPVPNLTVNNGKLIVQPAVNRRFVTLNQLDRLEDIDVSINASLAKSDDPSWAGGLVLWAKDDSNYYTLSVNGNGWFRIEHRVDNRESAAVAWRQNAAVKQGIGQINRLRMVTKGNEATAYINGTELITFSGQPPDSGSFIGVFGDSPTNSQNVWEFSDLKVIKP